MDINSSIESSISSVRQAIGVANLRKALNQDQQTVNTLMKDMAENTKIMEQSVNPHKGKFIDIKV